MKKALLCAGMWFFGTMILVSVAWTSYFKGKSLEEKVLTLFFTSLVVALTAFFYSLYEQAKEERKLEILERRNALRLVDDSTDNST